MLMRTHRALRILLWKDEHLRLYWRVTVAPIVEHFLSTRHNTRPTVSFNIYFRFILDDGETKALRYSTTFH